MVHHLMLFPLLFCLLFNIPFSLASASSNSPITITVDTDEDSITTTDTHKYWKRSFGSGHASLSLRTDYQEALARAAEDYGACGLRMHGIFDDDMNVIDYNADKTGYVYNWTSIDTLWDVQVENGMKPFVELGE